MLAGVQTITAGREAQDALFAECVALRLGRPAACAERVPSSGTRFAAQIG